MPLRTSGVSTPFGATALTRMPRLPHSMASTSVRPVTPNFAEQ